MSIVPNSVFEDRSTTAVVPAGTTVQQIRALVDADAAYGMELIADLGGCDQNLITDPAVIAEFSATLVDRIGMVAYGDPFLENFGYANPKTAGYTLIQPIETSSVTVHFAYRSAYLNVHSCKGFDPQIVVATAVGFFHADPDLSHSTVILRSARER